MPSGFRAFGAAGFLGCEGPAVALGSGIERALRMSAAEAAMEDVTAGREMCRITCEKAAFS